MSRQFPFRSAELCVRVSIRDNWPHLIVNPLQEHRQPQFQNSWDAVRNVSKCK